MNRFGYVKVAAATPMLRVADCEYNGAQTIAMMQQAADSGVQAVVFPELGVTASTCGDLFMQRTLLKGAEQTLMQIVEASADFPLVAIVGLPLVANDKVYNCAAVVSQGMLIGVVPKTYLSAAERKYFDSGANNHAEEIEIAGFSAPFGTDLTFAIDGVQFCVEIGQDAEAPIPPSTFQALQGAKIIFNLSAAAELTGKDEKREEMVRSYSKRSCSAYVSASAGFGESTTDMAFAGGSIIAENGEVLCAAERFSLTEQLIVADVDVELIENRRRQMALFTSNSELPYYRRFDVFSPEGAEFGEELARRINPMPFVPKAGAERDRRCEEAFSIQALGLVKRLQHTSCKSAVVGISGGLDSTLALLVTVKAFDLLGLDRKGIVGITMPGFGTTDRTYNNAVTLIKKYGVTFREIPIAEACKQHFADIGLPEGDRSVTYENAQARERTQILMDVANMTGGMVIGTGDLSELALGWATYNGDQMSMYGVNASVPKTLVRHIVEWRAEQEEDEAVKAALKDVVATPVSPELLPANEQGEIAQKTEDLVGPYELHDFFIYNFIRNGFSPEKILFMAENAFDGKHDRETILKWLRTFLRRFFMQQFKRSAMPDGPKVGSVSLSPRGDWQMPSDAVAAMWLKECDNL
ncbi:MAG: NAD(+) synthase [Alistipes sp.]|nr:NAD(+) synthase [Alistipes sp.]